MFLRSDLNAKVNSKMVENSNLCELDVPITVSPAVLHAGFRKIQPKPTNKEKSDVHKRIGDEKNSRLLESRSTRRGVRICPTCQSRVGYRSKICKNCSATTSTSGRVETTKCASDNSKKRRLRKRSWKKLQELDKAASDLNKNVLIIGDDNRHVDSFVSKEGNFNSDNLLCMAESQDSDLKKTLKSNEDNIEESLGEIKDSVNVILDDMLSEEYLPMSVNNTSNECDEDYTNNSPNHKESVRAIEREFEHSAVDMDIAKEHAIEICCSSIDSNSNFDDRDFSKACQVDVVVDENMGSIADSHNIQETCNSKERLVNRMNVDEICVEMKDSDPSGSLSEPCQNSGTDDVNCEDTVSMYLENRHESTSPLIEVHCIDQLNVYKVTPVGSDEQNKKKRKYLKDTCGGGKNAKVFFVQFVRMEPGHCVTQLVPSPKEEKNVKVKQNRILSSNPTRRGVKVCPFCEKDVGCRSRICKYCKVSMSSCPENISVVDQKNLLAVQLCAQSCPEYTLFSVKKCLDACEDRCFVRKAKVCCKESENDAPSGGGIPHQEFACDCSESESSVCAHISCLSYERNLTMARRISVKQSFIEMLPIEGIFKQKLRVLWKTLEVQDCPIVQQVCQNTLVVVDVKSDGTILPSRFVHLRFDKTRRRSTTDLHVFCSGVTCSAWNDDDLKGHVICVHYCMSLWAIASDNDLKKYFQVFLNSAQVFVHSDVF